MKHFKNCLVVVAFALFSVLAVPTTNGSFSLASDEVVIDIIPDRRPPGSEVKPFVPPPLPDKFAPGEIVPGEVLVKFKGSGTPGKKESPCYQET